MKENKKQYEMKPLEEMNVIDDFLFTEIMADEKNGIEVCRMILSCVLKREVRNIQFVPQKAHPGHPPSAPLQGLSFCAGGLPDCPLPRREQESGSSGARHGSTYPQG